MISKIKEKLTHHFQEVLKNKKSPHSIALGFAIGTFIGILPTPGFNILIGVLIVFIFERINKLSVFVGMAFWNPLVAPFVILLSYNLGNAIFGSLPVVKFDVIVLDQIYNFSRRLLVGNLILASSISSLSYFIVRVLFERHKRKSAKNI